MARKDILRPKFKTVDSIAGEKLYPKEEVDAAITRLVDTIESLETDIQNEMQKLFNAGLIKSYFFGTGHFNIDLIEGDLADALKKAVYWKKYYEQKYLELLPEDRKTSAEAKEA